MPNKWKNININRNLIKHDTGVAVLIAMPHSSDYDGWFFWHPEKLIRNGRNKAAVSLGYNDSFTFRLLKYKGKLKVDEQEIDVEEFEDAFGVIDENITSKTFKSDFETHKPKVVEVEDVEALDNLKDE